MYYILNYIPLIIQITILFIHICEGIVFKHGTQYLYIIFLIFITPIYLLIVNKICWDKEYISFQKSMVNMLFVILCNTLSFMINNKIQYGYFIGDVPEGIYYLMIGIPTLIIIIGMGIVFLFKS